MPNGCVIGICTIKQISFFYCYNTYQPTADLDYSPGILNLVTFQPPGNSVVCTRFEIIDDPLALEGEEKFVIDVSPRLGQVRIGRKNRTVITIEDNDGGLFSLNI